MGAGHVDDARELAAEQGLDPTRWSEVRTQLKLLAKREWYSRTRHGHARGWEAENFVNRVRQYQRFLAHHNDHSDLFQLAINASESANAIRQPDRS